MVLKKDIVERLRAEAPIGLRKKDIEWVFGKILEEIVAAACCGDVVSLGGFGKFEAKQLQKRKHHDINSGTVVDVDGRMRLEFTAYKRALRELDRSRK